MCASSTGKGLGASLSCPCHAGCTAASFPQPHLMNQQHDNDNQPPQRARREELWAHFLFMQEWLFDTTGYHHTDSRTSRCPLVHCCCCVPDSSLSQRQQPQTPQTPGSSVNPAKPPTPTQCSRTTDARLQQPQHSAVNTGASCCYRYVCRLLPLDCHRAAAS